MARVQGNYLVSFQPDMNAWTLSDNSRNESRSPANQDLNIILMSGTFAGNVLYFERKNILKIKRIMVESNGAACLRAPLKGFAAVMKFNLKAVTPLEEATGGFQIDVTEYNKWYDVNTFVRPFQTQPAPDYTGVPDGKEPYKVAISNQGYFSYDGYNLSADYVGQEWAPRVLMELDTPGVYNTSLVLI